MYAGLRSPSTRRKGLYSGNRLRNSGDARSAFATRLAVPSVFTRRSSTKPPPCTRNTEAPGWAAIDMFAYATLLRDTRTRLPLFVST